jgi:hypothetical protein
VGANPRDIGTFQFHRLEVQVPNSPGSRAVVVEHIGRLRGFLPSRLVQLFECFGQLIGRGFDGDEGEPAAISAPGA